MINQPNQPKPPKPQKLTPTQTDLLKKTEIDVQTNFFKKTFDTSHPGLNNLLSLGGRTTPPLGVRPQEKLLSPKRMTLPNFVSKVAITYDNPQTGVVQDREFICPRRISSPVIQLDGTLADLRIRRDMELDTIDYKCGIPSKRSPPSSKILWNKKSLNEKIILELKAAVGYLSANLRFQYLQTCAVLETLYFTRDFVIEEKESPIIAQSGAYDSVIKHYKLLDKIEGAALSKGLGKNRKKGSKSGKERRHPTVKNSKSSCRVSDHKIGAKLFLDNTLNVITPQINVPGFCTPEFTVKPNEETMEKIDELTSLMQGFQDKGVNFNINFGFMEGIKNMLDGLASKADSKKLGAIGLAIILIYSGYKLYCSNSPNKPAWKCLWTICTAASTLFYSGVISEHCRKIANHFMSIPIVEGEPIVAQSGQESIKDMFVALLYSVMAFGSMQKKNVSDRILAGFKHMGDMPKMASGVEYAVEWLTEIAQRFLNFVAKFFEKEPWLLTSHPHPEVMDYITRVKNVLDEFNSGRAETTYDYGMSIFNLEQEGMKISGNLNTRIPSAMRAYKQVLTAMQMLKPVVDRLRRSNIVGNGPRIPPVAVLLGGGTDIGKTSLLQFLMQQCGVHMVPKEKRESFYENVNNHIFNLIFENHFWDNYTGQTVVCQDDFGQATDAQGQPDNEYFKLIRMVNQNNFPLTMAHLEEKGNVNFTSKLVCATTNRESFKGALSIHSVAAVSRRFKLSYAVSPKEGMWDTIPGDTTGSIFKRTMKPECWPKDASDLSHLEFHPWDFGTGLPKPGPVLDYHQLKAAIIAEYESTHEFGERTLKAHKTCLRAEIDAMNAAENDNERKIVAQINAPPVHNAHSWFAQRIGATLEEPFEHMLGPYDPDFVKTMFDWLKYDVEHTGTDGFSEFIASAESRSLFTQHASNLSFRDATRILRARWVYRDRPIVAQGSSDFKDAVEDVADRDFSDKIRETMPNKFGKLSGIDDDEFTSTLFDHIKDLDCTFVKDEALLLRVCDLAVTEEEFLFDQTFPEAIAGVLLLYKNSERKTRNTYTNTTALGDMLDCCKDLLKTAWEVLKHFKLFIAGFVAAKVVLYLVSKFFTSEIEAQSETGVRQSTTNARSTSYRSSGGSYKTHRFRKGEPRRDLIHNRINPQAGVEDRGCQDMLNSVLDKNTYRMKVQGVSQFLGTITFVKGTHALTPLHFGAYLHDLMETSEEDVIIELWAEGTKEPTFQVPLNLMSSTTGDEGQRSDFTILTFPLEYTKRHKDITKKFMANSASLQSSKVAIYLPVFRNKWVIHSSWARSKGSIQYNMNGDPEPFFADETYDYDVPTQTGDCGNLLYVRDTKSSESKILGMHVAFQNPRGIATVIERQWILDTCDAQEKESGVVCGSDESLEGLTLKKDALSDEIQSQGFVPLATMERAVHIPVKTNIVPSRLHGTFSAPTYKPVHLCPTFVDGVLVDPMSIARAKYAKAPTPINLALLRGVEDIIFRKLVNDSIFDVPWERPRVFSFKEACEGIQDVPFFDGIPRSTSAGYPLSLDVPKGHHGKTHIFGSDGPYQFDNIFAKKLKADVDRIEMAAKQGTRCLHVYTDFLKDERKECHKVDQGKARMVSGAPLAHTILCRMYFGDFMRHIMSNRIRNGVAVGMNPFAEWDDLAHLLSSRSKTRKPNLLAGDYKSYDASLVKVIMLVYLNLANRWYADGNDCTRRTLFEDIVHSRHICRDLLYEFFGSTPSGCGPTATLNSIVNLTAIYIASTICILGDEEFKNANWDTFDWTTFGPKLLHDVTPVTFGDDNLIAVTDNVRDRVDQNKLTVAMATIGFAYTPENKIEGRLAEPLRSIEEVSFLKRTFARNAIDGRYTCPLQFDVILEMPQWTKKSDTGVIEETNIGTALEELSLHPEEVFNKWAPLLLKSAQEKLEYVPLCTTYKGLQMRKISSDGYVGSA